VGEKANLQSRRALLKQFTPQYREVSSAQKRVLLDTFALATGYHRGSGMWLLNHARRCCTRQHTRVRAQTRPDVQHALFLVWNAANRICAKRLIPFLPTLLEALVYAPPREYILALKIAAGRDKDLADCAILLSKTRIRTREQAQHVVERYLLPGGREKYAESIEHALRSLAL
jgi:hypothetical protein